jgi:hypothetical protein
VNQITVVGEVTTETLEEVRGLIELLTDLMGLLKERVPFVTEEEVHRSHQRMDVLIEETLMWANTFGIEVG